MRLARAIVAIVAAIGGAASVGLAASLSLPSDRLGGAAVSVDRCTTAGLSVLPNLTAGTIVSVTVSSLPVACGSATLQLTVNNGLTNSSGSATVPAGGGSVTVTLATATSVTTLVQTDLVVIGP